MTVNYSRVSMSQDGSDMLQRDTLPTRVLNVLMDWIMDGKLKMGDKLNTEELARQLGVSRMPIREAISSLEKSGLAESIPYVGTRLVTLDRDDVLQIYIMRRMLEPLVAEEACRKISEDDICHLERIHREYIELVSAENLDAKAIYLQNRKFHFTIYSVSGMDRICAVIESLWDTLSFFKLLYGREFINTSEKVQNMIDEHEGYLNALKSHDGKKLKTSLKEKLGSRIENISKNKDYYMI